ncbi:hypothetical protein ACTFIV_000291 [Dictyostelium citrinum]
MGIVIDLCKFGCSLVKGLFKKKDPLAEIRIRAEISRERRLRYEQEQKMQQSQDQSKEQIIKPTETDISTSNNNNNIKSSTMTNDSLLKNIKINTTTPSLSNNKPIETTFINTPINAPVTNKNSNNKVYIDLINIKGIGPKTIKELNEYGITTSEQLSQLSDQECDKLKSKIKKIYSFRSASQAIVQN